MLLQHIYCCTLTEAAVFYVDHVINLIKIKLYIIINLHLFVAVKLSDTIFLLKGGVYYRLISKQVHKMSKDSTSEEKEMIPTLFM